MLAKTVGRMIVFVITLTNELQAGCFKGLEYEGGLFYHTWNMKVGYSTTHGI